MQFLASDGASKSDEFGAGKALGGLMKRIAAQITVVNVGEAANITALTEEAA